jgi:hypothetical protein
MKQLERKRLITYRWWRSNHKPIRPEHVEALEESANNRIAKMMETGCTSGDLNDNIHMDNKDPADGVEYTGYWEVKDA